MNSTYVDILTLNYRGVLSLSGYTLPGCNFTFIPSPATASDTLSLQNVVWDFGDGTTSNSITATHSYSLPGLYSITLIAYDQQGQPVINTYNPQITAYDFINDKLNVDDSTPYQTYVNIKAGQYHGLILYRQNSWRSVPSINGDDFTVTMYASGSLDPLIDIDTYYSSQWSHLVQNSKFLDRRVAGYSYEYIPVSAIATSSTSIYVNADSTGEYKQCLSTDTNAIYAGSSGYATPYFTSDQPKNYTLSGESPLILFFTLNNLKLSDSFTVNKDLANIQGANYLNQNPTVIPQVYIRYNPAASINFTTNGICTQGDATLSTFNIPNISWQYTQIPFIARLVDTNNFTTKFYPNLTACNFGSNYVISLSAISNNQRVPGTFYSAFTSAAPMDIGGYFKGYFIPSVTATNVQFAASVKVSDPSYYNSDQSITVSSTTRTITGTSNNFNILSSSGVYNITKVNEDFDFGDYIGSLRYSDYQYNYTEFFNKFISTFTGTANSKPYELGKTIYEKIANFTDNNSNVDTANLQALISMCNEVGFDLESVNYEYPAQLKRIVDILSIKHKKLFGDKNSFNTDFNNNYSSSSTFAKNLGTRIDILSGTFPVSAGVVAYEKFSGIYTLLYTAQISGKSLTSVLPLSTYNLSWGWPLNAPTSLTGTSIGSYYTFYNFIPTVANDIVDSVINWTDPTMTLSYSNSSYSNWAADDGIMDNIINYEFVKGLRLFTSAANITYNN